MLRVCLNLLRIFLMGKFMTLLFNLEKWPNSQNLTRPQMQEDLQSISQTDKELADLIVMTYQKADNQTQMTLKQRYHLAIEFLDLDKKLAKFVRKAKLRAKQTRKKERQEKKLEEKFSAWKMQLSSLRSRTGNLKNMTLDDELEVQELREQQQKLVKMGMLLKMKQSGMGLLYDEQGWLIYK
ncbi:hypothetical protein ACFL4A_01665 [bacterium]